jgi:hypothetical protein
MATYTGDRLYKGTIAATTETTVYTVPANTNVTVKQILLCNSHTGDVQVTIKVAGTRWLTNKILSTSETLILDLAQVVKTGETITVTCNTANVLDVYMSGTVVV